MSEFTEMMRAVQAGDRESAEKMLPRVYDELRKLAAGYLANEPTGHARQATSLVHEAYLRLIGNDEDWNGEGHFFGAAAIAIRRILVENARARRSLKRGGNAVRLDLEEVLPSTLPEPVEDLIALDEALDRLSTVDPRATELVQLLYFSGLTLSQAAEVMGVSPRTADRLWAYAKAWLRREMRRNSEISEI
ncbi:RNA polymerase sigma factor [Gimesia chilikensis]|uniref:Sigma-70 family RNA polymerase sigma factor n=2 Tax=Gimesia TaxID=1649453 RepID=A0A6I6A4Q8_9PLAN|nr:MULTISPECIES: sigma-70 family RNA polymerase sigma factor [Gimesia]QDU03170.1 RNA polymerase sigma factor [Gimesia chilikensis]QGQ21354.1 sigma-70 family RNA polymerase sigma factor [Gimesia benthica]